MTTPNQLNAAYATQSQISSFFVDNIGIVSVKSYGAIGDSSTDDTTAIQNAIDSMSNGGTIMFPRGIYKITSTITVPYNVEIIFTKGAKIVLSGVDICFSADGCTEIKIVGSKHLVIEATDYVSRRPLLFYANSSNLVKQVHISKCKMLNAGIYIYADVTDEDEADIYICDNNIISDDNTDTYASGISSLDAWITTSFVGDNAVDTDVTRYGTLKIDKNVIDVHHQTGSNQDVVKLSGLAQDISFMYNTVINRNLNSDAEIDTFTAGFMSHIESNTLKNVSIKNQTIAGSLTPKVGEAKYNVISKNIMHFEENSINPWGILYRSAFGIVEGNVIKRKVTAKNLAAFYGLYINVMDGNYNEFSSTEVAASIITGNMVDVRYTTVDGTKSQRAINDFTTMKYCLVSNNIFLGGDTPPCATVNRYNQINNNIFISENLSYTNAANIRTKSKNINNFFATNNLTTPWLGLSGLTGTDGVTQTIDLTLPEKADANEWGAYLLYVKFTGGARTNYQTFLVFTHSKDIDTASWITPISSRIDRNTATANHLKNCFNMLYVDDTTVQFTSLDPYLTGQSPTGISYLFVPLDLDIRV